MPPQVSGEARSERARGGYSPGLTHHVSMAKALAAWTVASCRPTRSMSVVVTCPEKECKERSADWAGSTCRAEVQNAHESRLCRESTRRGSTNTSVKAGTRDGLQRAHPARGDSRANAYRSRWKTGSGMTECN